MATRHTRRAPGTAVSLIACSTATLAALLTGCTTADAICQSGQYPVQYVGATGGDCVDNGHEVPKHLPLPEGQDPEARGRQMGPLLADAHPRRTPRHHQGTSGLVTTARRVGAPRL